MTNMSTNLEEHAKSIIEKVTELFAAIDKATRAVAGFPESAAAYE